MKWPPYLLKLKFLKPDRIFSLWLPLFLIWPVVLVFLLAVFVILLPVALLTAIFTWEPDWLETLFNAVPALFRVFGHLSGLVVDVTDKQEHIYIEFV